MQRDGVSIRLVAGLSAIAVLLSAMPAAASSSERVIELSWAAPSSCPGVGEVRADLERIIGRGLDAGATPAIEARAEAEQEANGAWRLHILVIAPGNHAHERVVEGETCSEVAEAAKMIIALASGVDPTAPSKPARSIVLSEPTDADRPTKQAPKHASHPAVRLRVAGGADAASLPAPTPGFEAGLVIGFGATAIELTGGMWMGRSAVAAARPTAGGDISLAMGDIRLCRTLIDDPIELRGCGGLEAGMLSASGFGVQMPGSGRGPWIAPLLGIGAAIRVLPRFRLTFDLEALTPLVRDEFALANVGDVYRAPPITGRALFGIDVTVW